MTPYYSDDLVTIYHGDAREYLDVPADVLITDPPYGVGLVKKSSKFRDSPNFDRGDSLRASVLYVDDPKHVRALIAEVIRPLITSTGRALIFPGNRMLHSYPQPAGIGGVFNANGAGRGPWGFECIHPILYYGKDPYMADGKGSRPNGFRDEQPNPEHWDHPCPKPQKWMRWAVVRASRGGETVLDPFAGSGTTLVAAKSLGRKSVGIEIEERYCEIAATRCSQEVLGLLA